MKRMNYIKHILIAVFAIFLFSSCETSWLDESKHPMPEGVGNKPEFIFEGESTIKVNKLGGDYTATIKANQPWLVESTSSWITVTSDRVGRGDGTAEIVSFTVQKNPGLSPREGKIRMWITNEDEAYITVSQDPLQIEDLGTNYYVTVNGTGDGSSWENSTTLSKALAAAVDADKIYVAAGTYIPTDVLPGGQEGGDETFYVKANISLIGGYPANPKEGDVSDPVNNPTILSGNETCYHCMVVGAPKSELFSVKIKGFKMTKGNAFSKATVVSINGGKVYKSYGAGMVLSGSRTLVEDCIITENTSEKANAGVFMTGGAETTFKNCKITDNKGAGGNGKGVFNDAKAVTYMYNCEISKNNTTGVGAGVYNYDVSSGGTPSIYLANCEIISNIGGTNGGGVYSRAANTVVVNCTIHGNSAKNGAGIMSYGPSDFLTIISSTITKNTATVGAAGVHMENTGKVYLNNSIVIGNTSPATDPNVFGIESTVKSLTSGSSDVLGEYKNGVYPLLSGEGLTGGMTVEDLKKLSTNNSVIMLIPEDVEVDAKGNKRTGTVMGAYVGE